jgi:hypothetical protein
MFLELNDLDLKAFAALTLSAEGYVQVSGGLVDDLRFSKTVPGLKKDRVFSGKV